MDSERRKDLRRAYKAMREEWRQWRVWWDGQGWITCLAPREALALLDAADERDRLRKFADGTLTICPGCYADLVNGEPLSEKHLVCDRCGAIVEGFKPVTWQAAAFAMRDERDRLLKRIDRLVALCESEEEMDAIEGRE